MQQRHIHPQTAGAVSFEKVTFSGCGQGEEQIPLPTLLDFCAPLFETGWDTATSRTLWSARSSPPPRETRLPIHLYQLEGDIGSMEHGTVQGFNDMNAALKARVEASQ